MRVEYLTDALDNDKARSEKALRFISTMYQQERILKETAGEDFEMRKMLRLQKIQPHVQELKTWIETEQYSILPKSAIGKAMSYFLNQYPKFETIFEDGRIELDNNRIENAIRPMALGRKNYLFAGSHKAAQNAAMIYSFLVSCKMQGVNPQIWLQHTLEKLPDYNIQKLDELLPGYQAS